MNKFVLLLAVILTLSAFKINAKETSSEDKIKSEITTEINDENKEEKKIIIKTEPTSRRWKLRIKKMLFIFSLFLYKTMTFHEGFLVNYYKKESGNCR